MTYGQRILIALDQLVNALLGGWPDETLSSRCWPVEQGRGEGMAPACRGWAVFLGKGTLQE